MANVGIEDLERAVVQLGRSEKGQRAMSDLLALLEIRAAAFFDRAVRSLRSKAVFIGDGMSPWFRDARRWGASAANPDDQAARNDPRAADHCFRHRDR